MDVLESATNPFGGIVVDPAALPQDPRSFEGRLQHSLGEWTAAGFQVAWLEVPISHAALVPVAVEAGFAYHHADGSYLMLTRRLVDEAMIPAYASHYIGAGGVALNDKGELLVVREKRGRAGPSPSYKLPGGALHHGEHLEDGVVREVLEETGIRTRFEAVVCLRNQHGYRHGKSDIYFVCRLSPLSSEISPQPEEIEECVWLPLERYMAADNVSYFNKLIVQAALDDRGLVATHIDGYGDRSRYEFFLPASTAHQAQPDAAAQP